MLVQVWAVRPAYRADLYVLRKHVDKTKNIAILHQSNLLVIRSRDRGEGRPSQKLKGPKDCIGNIKVQVTKEDSRIKQRLSKKS